MHRTGTGTEWESVPCSPYHPYLFHLQFPYKPPGYGEVWSWGGTWQCTTGAEWSLCSYVVGEAFTDHSGLKVEDKNCNILIACLILSPLWRLQHISRNWKLIQLHRSDYNIIMLGILLCSVIFSVIWSSFYLCVCLQLYKSCHINCHGCMGTWYGRIFRYCLA